MCGFVGILDIKGQRDIDRALLGRMNDSQRHRGPDDQGVYLAPGIGLGHRRLSIIDLAGGHQPLFNEDRSVVVVYNGEIYNFRALAKDLSDRGHRFRTNCDTEVIVHAWEEWGAECVTRFRGMFAFALWDETKQSLYLARDRLGIKPLYYAALADGTLLFGSELKSLLHYPGLPRAIDPRAVEDYFAFGYVPDPKTIYRDAAKLPPGHTLVCVRGRPIPKPRAYWDVSFESRGDVGEAEVCEELVALLREAVDIRMIADVPLGAFLSGGVDSSAIVAMMAGLGEAPVNTCSIGFDQRGFDESRFAAQVARAFATRHHSRKVDAASFDLVDRLARVYDEPFADSSAIPTYRLAALARERVTVALSGDGGDEIFAGYRRYPWHTYEEQVRALLPAGPRKALFGLLGRLYPRMDWAPRPFRAQSTFQALALDSVEGYFQSVAILPKGLRERIFSRDLRRNLQGYRAVEVIGGVMNEAPADHSLGRVQYVDLKTYLPGDILTKVDRASMANSLEVRVPLLDHRLVEWAAGLPARLKLDGREGKRIFKRAMEPYLPRDLLYREKMGFSVPLAAWFRGPLRARAREALTGQTLADAGYFDMASMVGLLDQHQSGLRDHSTAIWALVMFESFLRGVHSSAPVPARHHCLPDQS